MPVAPKNETFWKFANGFGSLHRAVFKATGGRIGSRMVGADVLMLHHVGRKSGEERVSPLLYLADGDDLVIVASKGGYTKHPAWYHNLTAAPDTEVELKGERRRVHAETADAADRAVLWPKLVALYADYDAYQASTDRQIPVVRLRPRA